MVHLLIGKKYPEKNVDQLIGNLLREIPSDLFGVASRANGGCFIRHRRILVHQYTRCALAIGCEKMQPYFESIETLAWIKTGHIFFCKKTGYAVSVQFSLGNIGIDRAVEMLKNNDIVSVFAHFSKSWRFGGPCRSINFD